MKVIITTVLLFLTSCTTTKLIEVPVEKTKIEYRDKLVHDSIYVISNIDTHIRNDTIYINKYKYLYKERIINDTIVRVDSIPKVVKVETIKEVNKLKNWQVVLMVMGGGSIGLLLYKLKKIII